MVHLSQVLPELQAPATEASSSAGSDGALEHYKRLLAEFGIRKRYHDAMLNRVPTVCRSQFTEYIDNIAANLAAGVGLILSGPAGVGKTSMLSIVAKAASNKGCKNILFVDAYVMARQLVGDNEDRVKELSSVQLLLIDDLGTEYGHDWPMSAINHLFNKRYGDMLPTCVSTNISMARFERKEPDTVKYARIFDRWMDSRAYTFLEINAESQRK